MKIQSCGHWYFQYRKNTDLKLEVHSLEWRVMCDLVIRAHVTDNPLGRLDIGWRRWGPCNSNLTFIYISFEFHFREATSTDREVAIALKFWLLTKTEGGERQEKRKEKERRRKVLLSSLLPLEENSKIYRPHNWSSLGKLTQALL